MKPNRSEPIISDGNNPLVRTEEEMAEYFRVLQEAGFDLPPSLQRLLPE